MSRNIGSTFASRLVIAGIASLTLSVSLFVAGCSSDSNSAVDAGPCNLAAVATIMTTHSCFSNGCHDSSGNAASLNLTPDATLAARLVGVSPPGGGAIFPSVCSGMNKTYLVKGSNPATGLLLEKLGSAPSCGVRMPYLLTPLSTSEIACMQSWATTVTTAP
jgi:hypothetical protein